MTAEPPGAARHCGAATLRYGDYLCLDELLACQRPRSARLPAPIHDEHFFIVLHQAQELWFKQILVEMRAVLELDAASPRFFAEALPALRRIAAIGSALVAQLQLLRTLDAAQFMAMRPLLGTASGAQSMQFRRVEAVLGVLAAGPSRADVDMLPAPDRVPVLAALAAPSLHDQVVFALQHEAWRRGEAPRPGAAPAGTWQALPAAACALLERLRRHGGDAAPALRPALEALCAFEDTLLDWRQAHAEVVRDLLDELPGTGGSAGHAYLRARLQAQPRSALSMALRRPLEALA